MPPVICEAKHDLGNSSFSSKLALEGALARQTALIGAFEMLRLPFYIACLVGIFFSVLSSTAHAETTIPYRVDYGGWFTIQVMVNDQGPYDFIIDTGASKSLVFKKLDALQNFQPSFGPEQRILGTGSEKTFPAYSIGTIQIGTEFLSNLETVILDDWRVNDASPDGVLGLDFLRNYRLTFDAENQILTLGGSNYRPPKPWKRATLKRDNFGLQSDSLFTIDGRVERRRVTFLLDLGASGTIINGHALGILQRSLTLNIRPSGAEGIARITDALSTSRIARQIKIKRFSIGRQDWYRRTLIVYDAPIFEDLGKRNTAFGLFGSDFLKDRSFTIDFINDALFIGPKHKR